MGIQLAMKVVLEKDYLQQLNVRLHELKETGRVESNTRLPMCLDIAVILHLSWINVLFSSSASFFDYTQGLSFARSNVAVR